MNYNKDNALTDYITMTVKSWTFERMTEDEKSKCLSALRDAETIYKSVSGTWEHRFNVLHAVYNAFLMGIGYNHNPRWREPNPEEQPF